MHRRTLFTVCIIVGAVAGAFLLPGAGDPAPATLTDQTAHAISRPLTVVASGLFGAISGWAIGAIALYLLSFFRPPHQPRE